MAIEYRLMNAEEMDQVLNLWVEVYPGTERKSWKREFLSIPGSLEHTYVAVARRKVHSTAVLWVREMNDRAGKLMRVGNVSHVATHPEARRRGLAKRLLGLVIEHMERENCDFSTLFTSDEGRLLYERHLWRTCPLSIWQGRLAGVNIPQSIEYATRSSHPDEEPDLWSALSEVYTEFNKARPFAVQRDVSIWKSFTAYKISDWMQSGASLSLAYRTQSPEAICGYLIAHCTGQGFLIAEIGVKEGHRAAIPNLLYRVLGTYKPDQQVGGRLYLPDEPDILALLHQCLNPLVQIELNEMLVRPVNPKKDLNDFIGTHSKQAGMFWPLDQI